MITPVDNKKIKTYVAFYKELCDASIICIDLKTSSVLEDVITKVLAYRKDNEGYDFSSFITDGKGWVKAVKTIILNRNNIDVSKAKETYNLLIDNVDTVEPRMEHGIPILAVANLDLQIEIVDKEDEIAELEGKPIEECLQDVINEVEEGEKMEDKIKEEEEVKQEDAKQQEQPTPKQEARKELIKDVGIGLAVAAGVAVLAFCGVKIFQAYREATEGDIIILDTNN